LKKRKLSSGSVDGESSSPALKKKPQHGVLKMEEALSLH